MRNHPTTLRAQEHIENLRAKPLHVRENIALAVAGGVTLIVFLGWFAELATSRTFALTPTSPTAAAPIENPVDKAKSSFSTLLGAAGAATQGDSASPSSGIKILDSESKTNQYSQNATDATVIHF